MSTYGGAKDPSGNDGKRAKTTTRTARTSSRCAPRGGGSGDQEESKDERTMGEKKLCRQKAAILACNGCGQASVLAVEFNVTKQSIQNWIGMYRSKAWSVGAGQVAAVLDEYRER